MITHSEQIFGPGNSLTSPLTRFVVFGCSKDANFIEKVAAIGQNRPSQFFRWDYGRLGTIFLSNSHPDIAQSDEFLLIRLGFSRSASQAPLFSKNLLLPPYLNEKGIRHDVIHGNPMVICVSQHQPVFWVYQSLPCISQMYYWRDETTFVCSDTLRILTGLMAPLEINPDAIPLHLMYRTVPGRMTYIKNISKLTGGQLAEFRQGDWRIDQVERIDDLNPARQIRSDSLESLGDFERESERLIGCYVKQLASIGETPSILLSGGVDSTLIASLVKSNLPHEKPLQTLSYHIHVPSFEKEVEYARQAIDLLQSQHQFYDIQPEEYPQLLEHAIFLLAQPIDNEQDPCYLALARTLSTGYQKFLFSGSGSDCYLGLSNSRRLKQLMLMKGIPWVRYPLQVLGEVLRLPLHNKAYGMRELASLLKHVNNQYSTQHPVISTGMMTNLDLLKKSFDPSILRSVLEYKLAEFEKIFTSKNLMERIHIILMAHDSLDEEAAIGQFFRMYGLELVDPYLDTEFMRLAFRYSPEVRYYAHKMVKWIPKQLLQRRLGGESIHKPKLSGGFDNELFQWMKNGILKDHVAAMERPGYIDPKDFSKIIEQPDWLTWNLLNLDLFQKIVLRA